MWWNEKKEEKLSKLEEEKKDLKRVVKRLEDEKKSLTEEVDRLKHQKKMEEEDIKHMVKIDRERKDIEIQREKVRLAGEQAEEIAKVKDEYRDKTEAQLEKQLEMMKGMYGEILQRLPNYNVKHIVKE